METIVSDGFRVVCPCGHHLTGPRKDHHQEVACPRCGELAFVLPRSPWANAAAKQAPPRRWRRRDWLLPLSAMALTVAFLTVIFIKVVLPWSRPELPVEPRPSVPERIRAATLKLEAGDFRQAREQLERLLGDKVLEPNSDDERLVRRAAAEAALLGDLLAEPLEDILTNLMGMNDAERELQFQHRYQGKAVVFDAEFERDLQGAYRCNYRLHAGKELARLEFEQPAVLERVPLTQPQRLVLGLRLESIRLEAPGPTWVVRFRKDACMLLTSAAAAGAVCPELLDEPGRKVLERQTEWMKGR